MADTDNSTVKFIVMSLNSIKKNSNKPLENDNGKVRGQLYIPYES